MGPHLEPVLTNLKGPVRVVAGESFPRGRSIVAPVVDRGPFGTEAQWDLTAAAAQAVGLTETGRIGVLRLPAAPAG